MSSLKKKQISLKVVLALSFAILFWASAFVAIREALSSYSPGGLALLRFTIASLVLLIYALKKKMKFPLVKDLPYFFIIGFAGITVYHVALNFGELTVTAATSSFIINSIPVLTAILSLLLFKEKIKTWKWIGILLSFIGIALISFSEGEVGHFNYGILLVLMSAIGGSLYVVFQKKLLDRYNALEVTAWAIWIGTAFMLIFVPSLISDFRHATLKATMDVFYLGLFPAAISYLLWAYALSKFESATSITTYLYLSPLLTTIIGLIWIREIPVNLALVGGLIVLSGMILANTKGK